MGLAEALAARLQGQGRTAQVTCGELGSVTVEALPLRELEQLLRGTDGPRAVFYAACRELQKTGEEFRKAGKFYTPDQIVQFVSESETQAAARAVLSLSGWEGEKMSEVRLSPVQETAEETAPKAQAEPEEVRLSSVQDEPPGSPASQDTPAAIPAETRPEPMQLSSADIQPSPADTDNAGPVSYETGGKTAVFDEIPLMGKKAQASAELMPEQAHNVASNAVDFSASTPNDDAAVTYPHEIEPENPQDAEVRLLEMMSGFGEEQAVPLRETASDLNADQAMPPRETEPDLDAEQAMPLGKIKSDFDVEQTVPLREIKSDFPKSAEEDLHESKSAFPEVLRETELELSKSLREAKSELPKSMQESEPESAENLRETASEPTKKPCEAEPDSAERLAKALLDGLRRAKWVRGG